MKVQKNDHKSLIKCLSLLFPGCLHMPLQCCRCRGKGGLVTERNCGARSVLGHYESMVNVFPCGFSKDCLNLKYAVLSEE